MKRLINSRIHMVLLLFSIGLVFSSCELYYVPEPTPPPGSNHGYANIDPDLVGTWELAYANGYRVHGYDVNYLDFYSNGRGDYYYYDYGMEYALGFDFWSEYDYDANHLFINYYDGIRSQMTYWFSPDYYTLYLEWWNGGQRITYTYYFVDNLYWSPQKERKSENFAFRPGIATTLKSTQTITEEMWSSEQLEQQ